MELLKLLLAARATPTLVVMAESGLLGMVLGGVAHLASFENMIKVEAALGLKADAVRRLGALGVWVEEDAERLGERLRLSNAESSGSWRWKAGGVLRRSRTRRPRVRSFITSVRNPFSIGRWWPGHGRRRARPKPLGTNWRPCRCAGRRRFFRSRRRISSSLGMAAGPPLGAAMRAAEAAWIAADFPADRVAIDVIAREAAQRAMAR